METLRIEIVLKNELSHPAPLPEGRTLSDTQIAAIAKPIADALIAAGVTVEHRPPA